MSDYAEPENTIRPIRPNLSYLAEKGEEIFIKLTSPYEILKLKNKLLPYQINNLTNDIVMLSEYSIYNPDSKLKYILDIYKSVLTEKMQSIRTSFLGGKKCKTRKSKKYSR